MGVNCTNNDKKLILSIQLGLILLSDKLRFDMHTGISNSPLLTLHRKSKQNPKPNLDMYKNMREKNIIEKSSEANRFFPLILFSYKCFRMKP
uniref:Uncharacterized protein n=1 Tax=Strigamia maritima TaxID=126957 RepID=T1IUN4_STRMM